jgi:hypothetical protein
VKLSARTRANDLPRRFARLGRAVEAAAIAAAEDTLRSRPDHFPAVIPGAAQRVAVRRRPGTVIRKPQTVPARTRALMRARLAGTTR